MVSCFALVGPNTLNAQVPFKVYVSATADDSVGSRLAYAVREAIRRSAGLRYTNNRDEAAMAISIVTMNPDKNHRGENRTIYSLVLTVELSDIDIAALVSHSVGVCGSARVEECADEIVAEADEYMSSLPSKPNPSKGK